MIMAPVIHIYKNQCLVGIEECLTLWQSKLHSLPSSCELSTLAMYISSEFIRLIYAVAFRQFSSSHSQQVVSLLFRGNSVCFVHSSTKLTSAKEWVPSAPSPSSFCIAHQHHYSASTVQRKEAACSLAGSASMALAQSAPVSHRSGNKAAPGWIVKHTLIMHEVKCWSYIFLNFQSFWSKCAMWCTDQASLDIHHAQSCSLSHSMAAKP